MVTIIQGPTSYVDTLIQYIDNRLDHWEVIQKDNDRKEGLTGFTTVTPEYVLLELDRIKKAILEGCFDDL